MKELARLLDIGENEVISVIGSGGKTTFILEMARAFKEEEKILIGPTTKMQANIMEEADICFLDEQRLKKYKIEKNGINFSGNYNASRKKLSSLPLEEWKSIIKSSLYDKVLLEADGSKTLLLKGWAAYEPVILNETTITIGIIPITAYGMSANDETVFRFEKFKKIANVVEDKIIDEQILAKVIEHPKGLLGTAQGRKIVFINKCDWEEDFENAKKVVRAIDRDILKGIDKIVAGSLKNKKWMLLHDAYSK
jgi:probable selenium-dependent hydroxylase accessory protein YqeC